MTDLRKAAEMALEVMEYNRANGTPNMGAAIEALRQALAESANSTTDFVESKALAQPEQEQYVTKVVAMHEDGTYTTERILLPKREWVGLTDEEIDGIYKTHHDQYGKCQTGGFEYERTIEAKLKDKNI